MIRITVWVPYLNIKTTANVRTAKNDESNKCRSWLTSWLCMCCVVDLIFSLHCSVGLKNCRSPVSCYFRPTFSKSLIALFFVEPGVKVGGQCYRDLLKIQQMPYQSSDAMQATRVSTHLFIVLVYAL